MNDLGTPVLRAENPLEGDGVIFSGIASHNKDAVTVLQVNIMICHRTTTERLSQSRNRRAVSDAGLVIDVDETHGAAGDTQGPAFLVVDV